MHKVFICYHHANDQDHKDELLRINAMNGIFIDRSVDTGDISDELDDTTIREVIRDQYLRDSTVTIVLVGSATQMRKHVDWEIYSSMFDGEVNKKSGLLVINLPSSGQTSVHVGHDARGEKARIHPEISSWTSLNNRAEYERRYPRMPHRLIDNLLAGSAKISVVKWQKVVNDPGALAFLVHATSEDRKECIYDLSRPMRRANA